MCLEDGYGSFGDFRTMGIRGIELELCPPLILDMERVGCYVLVVKDLKVDAMAALCEAGHDPICGGKAVAFVAVFEWLHQDDIGVQMVGEH